MPLRSLISSVLVWPDRKHVASALWGWAREEARRHPGLVRLGVFGSYSRGDWGVGSDLDLVAILHEVDVSFERRGVSWRTERLPVPAEILVYSQEEWDRLQREGTRFSRTIAEETLWIYPEKSGSPQDRE